MIVPGTIIKRFIVKKSAAIKNIRSSFVAWRNFRRNVNRVFAYIGSLLVQITKVFVALSSIEFYSVFVVILFAGRSAGMACIVLCNLGRVTVCLRLNAFKGK